MSLSYTSENDDKKTYILMWGPFDCFQGVGQYSKAIKSVEEDIQNGVKKVNELAGTATLNGFISPSCTCIHQRTVNKQLL